MLAHPRACAATAVAAALVIPASATPQIVHYAYDTAGRLSVVADPRGDLAIYDYDAVGNLLSIRRLRVADIPGAIGIALVAPGAAPRGASISIFGKGFAPTPEGNGVAFNGARAPVVTASPTRLVVTVPPDATTGSIHLSAPLGTVTSPLPFRVLGSLTVTPPTALVAAGGSVGFTATGDDGAAAVVRWSVDGLHGGDPARGTITTQGMYVAPAAPRAGTIRVTAISAVDPAIEASAELSVIAPRSLFLIAPALGVGSASSSARMEVSALTSVGVATSARFATALPVALRVAPVVLSVTPATGARGDTTRVTVVGAGFGGAARLDFLAGLSVDPALVVTDLTLSADGTEATADVFIAADASVGPRIVRVVTPTGSSGDAALGANVFTIR
jgi:YD repeat-containing protein